MGNRWVRSFTCTTSICLSQFYAIYLRDDFNECASVRVKLKLNNNTDIRASIMRKILSQFCFICNSVFFLAVLLSFMILAVCLFCCFNQRILFFSSFFFQIFLCIPKLINSSKSNYFSVCIWNVSMLLICIQRVR